MKQAQRRGAESRGENVRLHPSVDTSKPQSKRLNVAPFVQVVFSILMTREKKVEGFVYRKNDLNL